MMILKFFISVKIAHQWWKNMSPGKINPTKLFYFAGKMCSLGLGDSRWYSKLAILTFSRWLPVIDWLRINHVAQASRGMLLAKKCIGCLLWVTSMSKKSFLGTTPNLIWLTAAIFDFGKVLIKHKQNLVIIVLLAKIVRWDWAILADMPNWPFRRFQDGCQWLID